LTNYLVTGPPRPSPDDSNAFILSLTLDPDSPLPVIDMEEDYGKYVVGPLEWALQGPEERWEEVKTVHAVPEYITPTEMAQAFQTGEPHILQPWTPSALLIARCDSVREKGDIPNSAG
jgi:hypothetical protein